MKGVVLRLDFSVANRDRIEVVMREFSLCDVE